MENYKIIYADELSNLYKAEVVNGLNGNAFQKVGLGKDNGSASFVILDEEGNFLAGMQGYNFYGCFNIDILFVKDSEQNKGFGGILIKKAEEIALVRKCKFLTVNTMSFEARPFYEKHGFKLEFIRNGFEGGASMYYLRKEV